ncbi:MAG: gamma-glutamyl-gamma-aminobutyrate hydrolase family protein [Tuberibacillus sp.]
MKPVIGISGGHLIDEGGRFPGYKRSYVNDDYVQSVVLGGGIPYIVPVVCNEEVIAEQIRQIDGLILSGGDDVSPLLYGEEPLTKLGTTFPERDEFDSLLIKHALEQKKPIFAICRGLQILNVAFGGSLYQDLSYDEDSTIKHDQWSRGDQPAHTVDISEDSLLFNILGGSALVNSFHHQAVKRAAKGFKITAAAKDGVIEALEKEGDDYVVGVQWHPEMMAQNNPSMRALFERLVQEAVKRKAVTL